MATEGPSPVASDLAQLRKLLEDERSAIRDLDAATILGLAESKESLLARLKAQSAAGESGAITEGLRTLMPDLRQNLVLLAHARDCLRDALEAVRGEPIVAVAKTGAPAPLRPGMRISVVG